MSASNVPTPTASAVDAQTWVYPPPGSESPPHQKSSNIGPIYLDDRILLQWYPPSTTANEVNLACDPQSSMNDGSSYVVSLGKNLRQPLTYRFTSTMPHKNASDEIFCWFYFSPSSHGNTVVWRFLNQQNPEGNAVEWKAPGVESLTASETITSATASVSAVTVAKGAGGSTAAGSNGAGGKTTTPAAKSSGLSVGAGVGIGIAAMVGLVLLVMVGVLLYMQRRKRGQQQAVHTAQMGGAPWYSQQPPPMHEAPPQPPSQLAPDGGPLEVYGSVPSHSELSSSNSRAKRTNSPGF